MENEEKLKKEVRELLSGGKSKLGETKKIVFDKNTEQFSIKIPKKFIEASRINPETELKIVVNPGREDFEEAFDSVLLIYEKRKTIT